MYFNKVWWETIWWKAMLRKKEATVNISKCRKHTGLNFLWNLISKRSPEYMLQFFLNLLGKNGNEVGLVFPSSIVVCFSEDVNMWTRLERNVFFFVFAFLQKWNKLSLLFLFYKKLHIKSTTPLQKMSAPEQTGFQMTESSLFDIFTKLRFCPFLMACVML